MINNIEQLEKIISESSLVSKTDARGRITFANRKFCEISKYTENELIGKDHKVLNSGHHSSEFWINMYKTTVNHKKIWSEVVKNKDKHGNFYWVKTYIQAIFKEDVLEGFISVRQDITKEVNQKQQLEEERLKLEKVTRQLVDKNTKLEEESQGRRDYNLKMEELRANNKLKLSSLVIVLIPIFIVMGVLIFVPVKEAVLTLVSGTFGMLIGGFLTDLLTAKKTK